MLHDETGAIRIIHPRQFQRSTIAAIGQVVTVTGTRTAFSGLQQIGTLTAG